MYESFKASVLGKVIGDGQCVSLVVNNSNAYVEALFPGVSWPNIIPPVVGAKDIAGVNNSYLTWIANDHNDPNQLPSQGDIVVYGATPASGYSNTYNNPYGHCGICDSANATGVNLLSQNSPNSGEAANVTMRPWKYAPCLGWLHPNSNVPTPSPAPAPQGNTITLPATTGPWHAYPVGGPYNPNTPGLPLLWPSKFGGLTYAIDNNRGNGIYTITTQDFGQRDIWTNGSTVEIN